MLVILYSPSHGLFVNEKDKTWSGTKDVTKQKTVEARCVYRLIYKLLYFLYNFLQISLIHTLK